MTTTFPTILANIMGPQGLFILFVLLLLFGARKLPELARGLGQAIREFSKAKNDIQDELMREPIPPPQPPRQIEADTVHVQPAGNTQPAGTAQQAAPQAQQPVQPQPTQTV